MSLLGAMMTGMASGRLRWGFIGYGTDTGTGPHIDVPSGFAAGDLLLFVNNTDGSPSGSPPSGFTTLVSYTANNPHIGVYAKKASGSETTISQGGSSGVSALLVYRSIDSAAGDVIGTVSAGTGTSAATQSVTTTADNDLVISIWAVDANRVITADAATTQRVNAAGSSSYLSVADENLAIAGATSARTATFSSAKWNAVTLSFKQSS